jgi:cell division protein ZapA
MAQVNVIINGRQFRMACGDGEEEHLLRLAQEFDQRIVSMREQFGEVGDTRLTIMAALTIADEVIEARRKLRRLEEEVAVLKDAHVAGADRDKATQAAIAAALHAAAERIEGAAKRLNQTRADGIPVG